MEQVNPALFAAMWAVIVGAVVATAWVVGRLSGKVDWKTYDEHKRTIDKTLTDIREILARLDERTKHLPTAKSLPANPGPQAGK